jgi:hypothetical protein
MWVGLTRGGAVSAGGRGSYKADQPVLLLDIDGVLDMFAGARCSIG